MVLKIVQKYGNANMAKVTLGKVTLMQCIGICDDANWIIRCLESLTSEHEADVRVFRNY